MSAPRAFVAGSLVVAAAAALGGTTATSAISPSLLAPTRYACYPAQFSADRPQSRMIVDAFSQLATVTLLAPTSVCAPAPGLANAFLTCYRTRVSTTRFRSRILGVRDAWSKLPFLVALYSLQTLCVPSARVDAGAVSPAKGLDLLACYTSKSKVAPLSEVEVQDAFAKSTDQIGAPYQVCAPAAIRGRRLFQPRRYFGCYSANSKTKGATIVVRNEFSYLKAILGPRTQICTTATVAG